jgi:hypothetical protein
MLLLLYEVLKDKNDNNKKVLKSQGFYLNLLITNKLPGKLI